MKIVKCTTHGKEFQLPTSDEEFVSGCLHDQIEFLCEHHEKFSECRFKEVQK